MHMYSSQPKMAGNLNCINGVCTLGLTENSLSTRNTFVEFYTLAVDKSE